MILDVADGNYTVTVSIARPYRRLFGISRSDGTTDVSLRIRTASSQHAPANAPTARVADAPSSPVPTMTHPDPSLLPELIPLPAYHVLTKKVGDRDYLDFAATVWNSGPSPLSVEGFRRERTDVMDAYQYFYDGRKPVGRAPV